MDTHDSATTGAPRDPHPDIETVISTEARGAIERAVEDNSGQEVFFVGRVDPEGVVEEVLPCAFGNDEAVPAITQLADDGDVVIHNHPSGALKPSPADLGVAATVGERSIGFYIVDNLCRRVHVVVPAFEHERVRLLDVAEVERLLGANGVLARHMENYEFRQAQIDMTDVVCRAFNGDGTAIIEAGTGTGKSMAYLLPAILWALDNKEKVVVSTNTINLQEQLIHKDIPFLAEHLGREIKAELVKGRGNYLCMRKVTEVTRDASEIFEPMQSEQLRELLQWAKTTKDGSLSDLNVKPDYELWDEVRSESDSCARTKCKFYQDCFFYRARRRAFTANLLVSNHALLMADLALRRVTNNYSDALVLPPYRRVILDEGHNLEDAATRAFSTQVTALGLKRMLRRWANPLRRGRGVLSTFISGLENVAHKQAPDVVESARRLVYEEILRERDELERVAAETAESLVPPLRTYFERSSDGRSAPSGGVRDLRITDELRGGPLWRNEIEPATRELAAAIGQMLGFVGRLDKVVKELDKELLERAQPVLLRLESHTARLRDAQGQLEAVLSDDGNVCAWLEYAEPRRDGDSSLLRWRTAPIDVGPLLKSALFEPVKTAIVTSATMTVNDRFDYMRARMGLAEEHEEADFPYDNTDFDASYTEEDREWDPDAPDFASDAPETEHPAPANDEEVVDTALIESPFDFRKQAFVAAPRDIPDPRSDGYESAVGDAVDRAVRASHGRAFVLFTSYGMLNRVADRFESSLTDDGFTVLRQGDMVRRVLLDRFRSSPKAVLFATSSFWEGVDVQGDALVMLILARLPFSVPSEPIAQARVEKVERGGGDAFREYSIPLAVIRFKQGFGRLIRSRSDYGAILILDSRVVRQSYGRAFLSSLPAHDVWKGRAGALWDELDEFFARHE